MNPQKSFEMIENINPCPACGFGENEKSNLLAFAADVSGFGLPDFGIYRCEACGCGITSPIPEETSAAALYMRRDSSNFDSEGGGIVAAVKNYFAERFIAKFVSAVRPTKILDYSTGNGRYAIATARLVPHATVFATDLHDEPPADLIGYKNIKYIPQNTFDLNTLEADFDLIILRHVLEHSYHPRKLIRDLAARLSPTGRLYIEVPNLDCSWAKLAGKYWPGFYTPYHVCHYAAESLTRMIESEGLSGTVYGVHMPSVGNVISRRWNIPETFIVKLVGISLFPLQWLFERIGGQASAIGILAYQQKK